MVSHFSFRLIKSIAWFRRNRLRISNRSLPQECNLVPKSIRITRKLLRVITLNSLLLIIKILRSNKKNIVSTTLILLLFPVLSSPATTDTDQRWHFSRDTVLERRCCPCCRLNHSRVCNISAAIIIDEIRAGDFPRPAVEIF